jgi:hypothetical protein
MKRTLKILFTAFTFLTLLNNNNIGDPLEFGLKATDEFCCNEPSCLDTSTELNGIENNNAEDPIVINWELLLDVQSKLHYYKELDMEVNVPQFRQMQKDLDGKEVIIEGFVIPIDDIGFSLALSKYPFANCFFCGKASPASVLSLYLKDQRKRYKVDDFRKFRGTLHLNYDNPYEFYYILRDARAI